MRRLLIALFAVALSTGAFAQGAVQQAGPVTPGHPSGWWGNGVVGDPGPASGSGPGISEFHLQPRGNGLPPYANAGSGPNGENDCNYDAPITSVAGGHYLCFSPNAQGGGLISYGAFGGAAALPLNCKVNGVLLPCVSSFGPIVQLSQFGTLDPTFTNDMSPIIAKAIAYGKAQGGAYIFVPFGTFKDNGCFDESDDPGIIFIGAGPGETSFASDLGTPCSLNTMFRLGNNLSSTAVTGSGFANMQVNANGKLPYALYLFGLQNGTFQNLQCSNATIACIAGSTVTKTNLTYGWLTNNVFTNVSVDETFGMDAVYDYNTLPVWTGSPSTSIGQCFNFSENDANPITGQLVAYGNSDSRNTLINPVCGTISGNGYTFGYSVDDVIIGGQYQLVTTCPGSPEDADCNAVRFEDTQATPHCTLAPTDLNQSAGDNFIYGLEMGKGWIQSDNRYAPPASYAYPCGTAAHRNVVYVATTNGGIDNINTMPGASITICNDANYCSGQGFGALVGAAGPSMQSGSPQGSVASLIASYAAGNAPGIAGIGTATLPAFAIDDTNLNQSNLTSDTNTGNVDLTTGINSGNGVVLNILGATCYVQAGGPCNVVSGLPVRNFGRLELTLNPGDVQTYLLYKKQSITLVGINNTIAACDGNISGSLIIIDISHVVLANSFYANGCATFNATFSPSSKTIHVVGTFPTVITNSPLSDLTTTANFPVGTVVVSANSGAGTITLNNFPTATVTGSGDSIGVGYNPYTLGGMLCTGNCIAIPITSTSSGAGSRIKYNVTNSDIFAQGQMMSANGVSGSANANQEQFSIASIGTPPGGNQITSTAPPSFDSPGTGGWIAGLPAALPLPSFVVNSNISANSHGTPIRKTGVVASNDSGQVLLTFANAGDTNGIIAGKTTLWVAGINPNAGAAALVDSNGAWAVSSVPTNQTVVLASSVWNAALTHNIGTVTWSGGALLQAPVATTGPLPALTLTGLGTNPSNVGNDSVGRVTIGTGSPSTGTLTLTFAVPSVNAPVCTAFDETTAGVNPMKPTPITTAVVFTGAENFVAGDSIGYQCQRFQ